MTTILMDLSSAWDVLDGVPLPNGYRVEITDGKIIMTPQGEQQWKVILRAAPRSSSSSPATARSSRTS
ncbi:hypothetical protein ACQ86F_23925 [Streptomyces venezuelae ATCC 10712]